MKKLVFIGLALLMLLSAAAAEDVWQVDLTSHWQEGNAPEAHEMDEYNHCTVCGADVYGDGEVIYVTTYNEYGDTQLSRTYLADGTWVFDMYVEREYEIDHSWLSEKVYIDGVLKYAFSYDRETWEGMDSSPLFPKEFIEYFEDGSYIVQTMNVEADVLAESKYLADGTQVYHYTCKTIRNAIGLVGVREYYDGNELMAEWRFEYDDNGNYLAERRYEKDRLAIEKLYTVGDDSGNYYNYLSEVLVYHEDGTADITLYDKLGHEITQ
ncbi:MAG: hypothetical protein IKT57_05520 [Clostridia bacterium]|nr:hypothetical protein [Clostridia bacterium]